MSPNHILATASLSTSTLASAGVHIDESIPYHDKGEIDIRIVSECLEVGNIMPKSLQETATKSDVTAIRNGKKQGTYADIAITSVMSAGDTLIGYVKGTAAPATLYADGKQVSKKILIRSPSGDMFDAYESSCVVLNRTSRVLGSDIAQWVVRERKNAQDK